MSSGTSPHMLLFRGNDWMKGLSAEEAQTVTDQWMSWFEGLVQEGKAKSGHPLQNSGKVVSGKNGSVVADGPFAESKEAIGGYFFLEVADFEEAVAIAQKCPGLPYGAVVEVRPVAERCPMEARLEQAQSDERLASAKA